MPVLGTEEMTAPSSTLGLGELEMSVFRSEHLRFGSRRATSQLQLIISEFFIRIRSKLEERS